MQICDICMRKGASGEGSYSCLCGRHGMLHSYFAVRILSLLGHCSITRIQCMDMYFVPKRMLCAICKLETSEVVL